MISTILYTIGIGLAAATGWWLRGLRDEDRAALAKLQKEASERWATKKWVKPPGKDWPYP